MMQREEIRNGRKESRMFVDKGGTGALHWQRRARGIGQVEQWRYTSWKSLKRKT